MQPVPEGAPLPPCDEAPHATMLPSAASAAKAGPAGGEPSSPGQAGASRVVPGDAGGFRSGSFSVPRGAGGVSGMAPAPSEDHTPPKSQAASGGQDHTVPPFLAVMVNFIFLYPTHKVEIL